MNFTIIKKKFIHIVGQYMTEYTMSELSTLGMNGMGGIGKKVTIVLYNSLNILDCIGWF